MPNQQVISLPRVWVSLHEFEADEAKVVMTNADPESEQRQDRLKDQREEMINLEKKGGVIAYLYQCKSISRA